MIDTADSRFAKAVALADQAGQWLKCRTAQGRKAYGIRSSRDPNHVYFVTQTNCDCEDTRRHPALICKHHIAVLIHIARVAGTPMPASDTIDGLAEMVAERHPVLDMIRHPDGEITWERHNHADGQVSYLPRHTRPAATAADYSRIASAFFGEE
jgi:hypothetical protein